MSAYRPSSDSMFRYSKETLGGYTESEPPSPTIRVVANNQNHLWDSKYRAFSSEERHREQRLLARGYEGRGQRRSPLTSTEGLKPDGYPDGPLDPEYPNEYHFPPKYPLKERIPMSIVSLWNFYNTGFGFFAVIYALNIVAWGGIWFLLLVKASPAMCQPDCDSPNAPRQRWMETATQVLNALMCVMGFGLAPWRLRDLYYLLRYRLGRDHEALQRYAAVHRDWFRLPGSDELPVNLGPQNVEEMEGKFDMDDRVPYPPEEIPEPPRTGVRAPPTRLYRVDMMCWFNLANTAFQCCLASILWAMSHNERPEWATAVFVAFACTANMTGNILRRKEKRLVDSIEGIEVSKADKKRLIRDSNLGIKHYNNINDEAPKTKKAHGNWEGIWSWRRRNRPIITEQTEQYSTKV